MDKVLVTPRSLTTGGAPALDMLKQAGYEVKFSTPGQLPDENELIEKLSDCVGYLAGVESISAKVLESSRHLKVISRNGTGVDNIDLNAARRLNITVCRAQGANARGVAELTLGLIFSLMRSIPFSDSNLKQGQWTRKRGLEVENLVLGVIGCGEIGKRIAALATGVGMQVCGYDPLADATFCLPNFSFVSLDELFQQSDVISLHCPALKDEKSLIDAGAIAKMKKGIYLINTARASLLDDDAVAAGLEQGHIAGLALDVFDHEPPDNFKLVGDSRVIATPHMGGFTVESISRATTQAVENIISVLQKKSENRIEANST
jgi:phosphoglycerate dehydrogenase-like enzyme